MTDVFVPDHRVLDGVLVRDNTYSDRWRPGQPVVCDAVRGHVSVRHLGRHVRHRPRRRAGRPGPHRRPDLLPGQRRPRRTPSSWPPWPVPRPTSRPASATSSRRSPGFYDTVARRRRHHRVQDRLRFRVDQVRATDRAITAVNELYRLMGSSLDPEVLAARAGLARPAGRRHPRLQQPRALLPGVGPGVLRRGDPAVRPVLTEAPTTNGGSCAGHASALAVVVAAAVVIGLNATMLNVALPSAGRGLGASVGAGHLDAAVVPRRQRGRSGGSAVSWPTALDPGRVFRVGLGTFVTASLASGRDRRIPWPSSSLVAVQGAGSGPAAEQCAAIVAIGHPAERRRWRHGRLPRGLLDRPGVRADDRGSPDVHASGGGRSSSSGTALGAVALVVGWRPMGRLRASTGSGGCDSTSSATP